MNDSKKLDTHSVRLSDKDITWLERNGDQISKQIRRDLAVFRLIEESARENPAQPLGEALDALRHLAEELI